MPLFPAILIALSTALSPELRGAEPPLEHNDYLAIRDVAAFVTHKLPQNLNYYLGIGRGPAGLMAYLQLTQKENASTFPFSAPCCDCADIAHFNPETHAAILAPFFETFLPKEERLNGKRLIVIDDTLSGGTLLFFLEALKHYYKSRKQSVPQLGVVALAVSPGRLKVRTEIERTGALILEVDLNLFPAAARLISSGAHKAWAEYENPEIALESGSPLGPRPEFIALKKKMASFLLRDDSLASELIQTCWIQVALFR